jgi:Kef-type K+ transport system membrane component KefB
MARDIVIDGSSVKVRHPLAPLGLGLITLGVYPLVWYFKINSELRSQGEDVSPGVALLAITLGAFLIVPPFVSIYNTAERIRRVQERKGVDNPISAVLALVLLFIPFVNAFQSAYLQAGLNRAWERAAGDFVAPSAVLPPEVDRTVDPV